MAQTLSADSNPRLLGNFRSVKILNYVALSILGVLLIEFVASALFQQRSQAHLMSEFKTKLATAATAIGSADVSPLPDTAPAYGEPVALIQIPAIGLSQVVVEGASSKYTQLGPGHVPGTVLPGQAGEAVIVGRRTTFGAPFFKVPTLRPGTDIKVVTIEGPATYRVVSDKEALATKPQNQLKLITSNPPVLAFKSSTITAVMQEKPYPDTAKNSRKSPASNEFALMVLLLQVLVVALFASTWIYRKYGAAIGWLLVTPLIAGSFVALTLALDTLLPASI